MNIIYAKNHPVLRCSLKDPMSPWNIFCNINIECEYKSSFKPTVCIARLTEVHMDKVLKKAIEIKDEKWAGENIKSKNKIYNMISKMILNKLLVVHEHCHCYFCNENSLEASWFYINYDL